MTKTNTQEPRFTFTMSSQSPEARVRCKVCGWTAKGSNPRRVFPKADAHTCPVADSGARNTHEEMEKREGETGG